MTDATQQADAVEAAREAVGVAESEWARMLYHPDAPSVTEAWDKLDAALDDLIAAARAEAVSPERLRVLEAAERVAEAYLAFYPHSDAKRTLEAFYAGHNALIASREAYERLRGDAL